jgi:hypothetical protein
MSRTKNGRAVGKGFPFAKIVVVLAISFLVGLGLCGLSIVLSAHGFPSNEEFGGDSLGVASFSLFVMILSAAALALTLIGWAVAGVVRAWRETGESQTLPGSEDDEQKPK